MHDPNTLAFSIKYPWPRWGSKPIGGKRYREDFINIWHVDPEHGGSDDSCGWFMRAHHGDKNVLEKIIKRVEYDWDNTYTSEADGTVYPRGLFRPDGSPHLSPMGITLNIFFIVAIEHFGTREKAVRWMQKNLIELLLFAENPFDSLHDGIVGTWGIERDRAHRIRGMASSAYGWLLRSTRPWYKHPRWHFWHWEIQVIPWQKLRKVLFDRCCTCGGRFGWGEHGTTGCWDLPKPKLFQSTPYISCPRCSPCGGPSEALPPAEVK
jgi:hypothetical protein